MSLPNGRVAGPRAALVLLAAGEGRRAGQGTNKVLLPLAGRPVFTWSLRTANALPQVSRVVVVIREQDRDAVQGTLDRDVDESGVGVGVVVGGATRHDSEWAALQSLAPSIEAGEIDVVAIHDAARPLASADLLSRVVHAGHSFGAAIPALLQTALTTLDGQDPSPETRAVVVQTPQAFRASPLLAAYTAAARDGFVGTDTASCVERYTELSVRWVVGEAANLKITFAADLPLVERLLVTSGCAGGRRS